jgi:hypothetical protein
MSRFLKIIVIVFFVLFMSGVFLFFNNRVNQPSPEINENQLIADNTEPAETGTDNNGQTIITLEMVTQFRERHNDRYAAYKEAKAWYAGGVLDGETFEYTTLFCETTYGTEVAEAFSAVHEAVINGVYNDYETACLQIIGADVFSLYFTFLLDGGFHDP